MNNPNNIIIKNKWCLEENGATSYKDVSSLHSSIDKDKDTTTEKNSQASSNKDNMNIQFKSNSPNKKISIKNYFWKKKENNWIIKNKIYIVFAQQKMPKIFFMW